MRLLSGNKLFNTMGMFDTFVLSQMNDHHTDIKYIQQAWARSLPIKSSPETTL